MKAVGQVAGGLAAYDAGKYTRKVMKVNSRNTLNASVGEQEQIRRQAREAMGAQIVSQAGSGFQVGTGSALDSLRESAINREMDIALSRQGASMKAQGFEQQGKLAYAQGKSAAIGGIISGAMTLAEQVAGAVTGGAGGAGAEAGAADAGGYGGGINFGGGSAAYFAQNPFGG